MQSPLEHPIYLLGVAPTNEQVQVLGNPLMGEVLLGIRENIFLFSSFSPAKPPNIHTIEYSATC